MILSKLERGWSAREVRRLHCKLFSEDDGYELLEEVVMRVARSETATELDLGILYPLTRNSWPALLEAEICKPCLSFPGIQRLTSFCFSH